MKNTAPGRENANTQGIPVQENMKDGKIIVQLLYCKARERQRRIERERKREKEKDREGW